MAAFPSVRTLHAPKEGNGDDQYEDAFASSPAPLAENDDGTLTIALADGASSAVFAREWANLLVTGFSGASTPFPVTDVAFVACVGEMGREWRARVENKATSWYAQEKLPHGSSAALLVVTWDLTRRTWEARAVGDVCVFLVRANKLRYAFPMTKASRFDDRPALLSTELANGAALPPRVLRFTTAFETGDRFLLMTDALAAFFLAEFEAKHKPWNDLPRDEASLPAWLKARRDSGRLKNDDVTLIDLTL